MFKKRFTTLAAIAVGSLVLAACGSSSNPLDASTDNASADAGSNVSEQTAAPTDSDSDTDTGEAEGSTPVESEDSTPSEAEGSTPVESDEPAGDAGPIVIGSGNFIESELIAGIYAAALKAQGVDVSTHLDIGSREVYLQAIEDGSINLLPEYIGGVLAFYDKDSDATAPDEVYAAAKAALPDSLQLLDYSKAQDQDSITVTKATADKYDLKSIGDLAPHSKDMSYGASPEMKTRADGPIGLKKLYGVEFKKFVTLDPGGPLSVKGLTTGLVDVADIFTTDPAIETNGFVVLEDPLSLYQAQNVVPLVRKDVASAAVTDTLNKVSAALTTEALSEMQKTISDTKADPVDVGAKWVADNGLS